jgi:hypothetical protein
MPIADNLKFLFRIDVTANVAAAGGRAIPQRNTFYYRRTATTFLSNKTQLNTIFVTTVLTPLIAALNSRYVTNLNLIRCINDATDAYAQFTPALTGAITTDSYDSRSSVYMQLRSGFRGRAFNGSKHFSPLSEIDTTGDVLTGTGLTRWQAVATALGATMTDAGGNIWVPCILSGPPISQIETNPTTVFTWDVASVALNKAVGQMRRRRAGSVY